MDTIVSAIIHLAYRDYPALGDDFIDLKILPADCNRGKVIPLMDKALSPYVKGGGAKQYEEELKSWDHACGVICVAESGGEATDASGAPVLTEMV